MREGIPVDWQDVVSRFTMDSATDFLFGKDVRSLDAPLPYPSTYVPPTPFSGAGTGAPCDTGAISSVHPADRFVRAFLSALEATATRGRFLQSWPLFEFWGDKVKQHLTAVDEFIDPIVADALSEKASASAEEDIERKEQVRDDETLLQHLVKFTDGT